MSAEPLWWCPECGGPVYEAGAWCPACEQEDEDDGERGVGFWSRTPDGHTIHVNGARAMSDETLRAIATMADLAYEQYAPKHTRVAD